MKKVHRKKKVISSLITKIAPLLLFLVFSNHFQKRQFSCERKDTSTYQSLTSEWLRLQYWSNHKAERKFQICKFDTTFANIESKILVFSNFICTLKLFFYVNSTYISIMLTSWGWNRQQSPSREGAILNKSVQIRSCPL